MVMFLIFVLGLLEIEKRKRLADPSYLGLQGCGVKH